MINEIGINSAQFLQLDTNIRTSSTSTFNAQEAYENTFEDLIQEEATKTEQEKKEYKINFDALGMPPGFILDTSLLDSFEN